MSYRINVPLVEEAFRFIEKILLSKGYTWSGSNRQNILLTTATRLGYIYIDDHSNMFIQHNEAEICPNLIEKLVDIYNLPLYKSILIGNNPVEFFSNGGIKVACITVDYETIKKIYDNATKMKGWI